MTYPRIRKLLYSLRFSPLHPQWFAYRYERIRYQLSGKEAHGSVLDVGCGRQAVLAYLTEDAIYHSLDSLSTGSELYGAQPEVFGDATLLPFRDKSFDTVILLEILEHLPNPNKAIQEAKRILKDDGHIILSAPFLYPTHDAPHDHQRWTKPGFSSLISKHGLKIRYSRTLGSPIESSILLLNLSLSWSALSCRGIRKIFLMFCSVLAIPVLNILGYFISLIFPISIDSPFGIGHILVAKKM